MKPSIGFVTRTVGRQLLKTKQSSPTIMFGVGLVGVVAGTVLACKATLCLDETLAPIERKKELGYDLHEAENDYTDAKYRQDMTMLQVRGVVAVGKLYGPALIVGGLGIIFLTGSHKILTSRNAALTAAYAGLERTYNAYRRHVADEIGEDKERELHYEVQKKDLELTKCEEEDEENPRQVGDNSIYARFFDEVSKNWNSTPEYNMLFLRAQQTYANDLLHSRGHIFLNEVYDMIGVDRSKAGAVVGWVLSKDGDNYVDFGIFKGNTHERRSFVNNAEPSILLDFNVDGVIYDKI